MSKRFSGFPLIRLCLAALFGLVGAGLALGQTSRESVLETVAAQSGPLIYEAAEVLFRFPAGGLITYGPTAAQGLLWFLSDSRVLHIVSEDGVALGMRSLPQRQLPFIVCDPFGRALVMEGPSQLSLVNRAGQAVWSVNIGQPLQLEPVVDSGGRVYLVAGAVAQARLPNGRLLWQQTLSAAAALGPVLGPADTVLYTLAGGALQLRSTAGELLAAPAALAAAPMVARAGPDGFYIALADGNVVRLDAQGQRLAELSGTGRALLAMQPTASRLYLLDASGQLSAHSASGELLWATATAVRQAARLQVYPDRIVALSAAVAASYNLDGELLRELRLSNSATPALAGQSGAVFSSGRDWILYAYRFERPFDAPAAERPRLTLAAAARLLDEELFWVPGGLANEDSLRNRLFDIEKSVKSGTIGVELERSLLLALALATGVSDSGAGSTRSGLSPLGLPTRVQACAVVGLFAEPETVAILATIFRQERDPVLLAAVADAIAAIGLDPAGAALAAFAAVGRAYLDNRVALAVIGAIEAVYRGGGNLDRPAGAAALVRFLGPAWSRVVRQRAETALRNISAVR
ncbi:MAG: hypothetical protein A2087_02435 [Spirochaetes bacterium GWD1_61_31]|nr:MAG: hypothetical protein A2Y37_06000 [Spirochaetes bacterium GWB1_60_80]OHD35154.1 MAG: hypothetical protein A2004_08965 [Spirochaetes bacterium GWC1_61_12]OHD36498.1 MAG: hypothetical protein A2087_02435 [Spirochaetes bacterium GWD1_61_31]OHD43092.1 MAG: hypothetical protein A2Y35_01615 [Spirochaetes bacterium GWE1_60_18]OHD59687.1 MAG: hypothetical protein A2Y32_12490 [Spirochaetes bacterium GWF1_60_12]HAP44082.1 hypothetical protein [Spirochaetaceae bacterium]